MTLQKTPPISRGEGFARVGVQVEHCDLDPLAGQRLGGRAPKTGGAPVTTAQIEEFSSIGVS